MATAVIENGPSVVELGIAWAYAHRKLSPHLVEMTFKIEGREHSTQAQIQITSLEHRQESGAVGFEGRMMRFDGDLSQKLEGVYFPNHRHGQLTLIESNLIPDII